MLLKIFSLNSALNYYLKLMINFHKFNIVRKKFQHQRRGATMHTKNAIHGYFLYFFYVAKRATKLMKIYCFDYDLWTFPVYSHINWNLHILLLPSLFFSFFYSSIYVCATYQKDYMTFLTLSLFLSLQLKSFADFI